MSIKLLPATLLSLVMCCFTATHAQVKPLVFTEFDLPNEAHVILLEDHTAPVVATVIHYKVGSRDEDPARTGFAHFFEHLMFESTDKIERGTVDKLVTGAGGQLNAYTSVDETVYHFEVPSNQFKLALWIEGQRMRKLNINPIGVETQRGVVKEERKNRYDNAPYGGWYEKVHAYLFANTPYAWSPIGSSQHIDSASIAEFKAFYDSYYQPNNAIISIAGDFNPDEVREVLNAYFAIYPKAPSPIRPVFTGLQPMTSEIRETIKDPKAQLQAMFMGYRGLSMTDDDAYAADLLSGIMTRGESSRMYRTLVDSLQVAVQVSMSSSSRQYAGSFLVIGIAAPGKELADVEAAIDAEIKKLLEGGITDAELAKAKNQSEVEFISQRSGMYNKALQLASYSRYFGNTGLVNNELEKYMKVTKEDVMRVAQKILKTKNRVVLNYLPSRG
ncbi:MAG: insulinase family protein [Ignavibacteria bacterium]|nr:insulinase family protein [Ignavibacteria bacterium]